MISVDLFFSLSFKVGTHEETSPYKKSQGQVPSCDLAIFASKSQFGLSDKSDELKPV